MTDWAAPGGRAKEPGQGTPPTGGSDGPPRDPDQPPPYAPPPPPPPPQYGERVPTGTPRPGWSPPPKPGLLPLRPLTFGDILAAAFNVIRRNPKPTFGLALLMSLATIIIVSAIVTPVSVAMFTRAAQASLAERELLTAGAVLVTGLTAFATAVLSSALTGIVQGIISLEVARATLGERHTIRSLWRAARGRLLVVIGWTLLVSAVVTGAFLLIV